MNALFKHTVLAALFITAGITTAQAAPTSIAINGLVVASPCTVDTTNSNLTVDLGTIQAADLAAVGNTSTAVPFQLKLKDCPAATTSAVVTFGGTADPVATTRYISTGTASNVAVEVLQASTGNLKGPTTNITQSVQADRTVTYALQSRAYAKGAATPGTIVATVQATFSYN
ncbi:fimbrial protein [Serratia quinivorans]|uniref:fimbrial protein n=1 Tax=Serratia quinivorans TaxID=137545 RepID=UPI003F96123F